MYAPYAPYGANAPGGEKAGFWRRVGSSLLDSLLYGLVFLPFGIVGAILLVGAFDECVTVNDDVYCPDGEPNAAMIAGGIAVLVIGIILVAIIYLRALGRTGQTWGRKITNIRVIGRDSLQPIGVGKALGRYLIQVVFNMVPFLSLLDILWMLWDDQKQTLHDKVVGSIVVEV